MDASEIVAYKYLEYRGFKKIVFEPEGKSTPPDFFVDDRIAVEVRRLNQNEASLPGMKTQGLEEVAFPVREKIRRLLPSLGRPEGQFSWYVNIRYSRPVPGWRQVKNAIYRHLEAFRDSPMQPATIQIFEKFELWLVPANRLFPDYFVMGGGIDRDSGGWVIPELERNLKICIDDKTAKMSGIRAKYAEWWLVLIDRINYGTEEVLELPPHAWDKIILVSPQDHTQAFEVE